MDFSWSGEQLRLRARARELASEAVSRYGAAADSWLYGYNKEFAGELADAGLVGMTWPAELGGQGRPAVDRLIVAEEMITAGAPIASVWFADRQIGPSLIAYGSQEQQQRWLPSILNGTATWCIGMSEPDAGSDLAGLRTSARRDGDHYVINGRKIWTSFGDKADWCYLICRTSREPVPHAGISELIVPMNAPGVEARPIKDMVGNRHFCEITFTEVRVHESNLVGVEGLAFKQTMRQLEHERGGADRLFSNHALFMLARRRARSWDPLVRQELATLETGYRIGRLLVIREALRQAPSGFSAATKCFCTEHEARVAAFASRVLGAEATLWGAAARSICYAPAYTIMGGTSDIMRNIMGERVLGLPR